MIESSELRKYSFFGGLMPEQIDSVFLLMKHENYGAGEDIIREGEQNGRVLFIVSGRVAVVKKGLTLIEFKEGETVGEMEVLDMQPAAASIRAICPVEVASLSHSALHEVYKQDVKTFAIIMMNLARDLSRRLRKMDDRVVEESPYHEWS
jgi:CRP-like cAMP-binding protein